MAFEIFWPISTPGHCDSHIRFMVTVSEHSLINKVTHIFGKESKGIEQSGDNFEEAIDTSSSWDSRLNDLLEDVD